MAVKIRLRRIGGRKEPHFRIVVSDSRKAPTSSFIEELGYYDPEPTPSVVDLNEEKALEWLQKGAKPSDTVRSLLSRAGLMKKLHEIKNK